MDDELLVSRAVSGDLDALGQLYDAYFARVYDFAWRMLRDAGQADDATRAIFLDAARNLKAAQKASSFEAWIFELAHARLVGQAGAGLRAAEPTHEEGFGAFDVPDPCRVDDPRITDADRELPCDVWEAAASLSPRDYSLLDLHLRQKIEGVDLAHLAGVGRSNAPLMLDRLEQAARGVIATYLLARRGAEDCEELRRILAEGTFPPLTAELRTSIDTHAAACPTCRRSGALPFEPLQVFAALTPVAAPFVLKGEVWRSLVSLWQEGDEPAAPAGAALTYEDLEPAIPSYAAATALPYGASGGGGSPGGGGGGGFFEDESRRNIMLFAAAAGGMLIVAFFVGALTLRAFGGGGGGGGAGTSATRTASGDTATPRTTLTPGVVVDTATPRTSATAGPTDTPAPPPTNTPPAPPPPPSATAPKPSSTPNRPVTPTPNRASPTPTRRRG